MKLLISKSLGIATLTALLTLPASAQDAPSKGVEFGSFADVSSGRNFVEVNINSNLIGMVVRLAEKNEPEVAEFLRGLERIRVNVIGLDEKNRAEVQERVQTIRNELGKKGWERIVTAKQEKEDVSIFIKLKGEEAVEGIVVTVLNKDREAVLVNIVGNIQPEKLGMVGERFNIEPLKKLGPAIEEK